MSNLFHNIFGNVPSNHSMHIYGIEHCLFLIFSIIFVVLICVIFYRKSQNTKEKISNILAIILVSLYIFDFFVQPFWYGGLCIDKLPFHICTLLSILIMFVSFCGKFKKYKSIIVAYSILAAAIFVLAPINYFEHKIAWYSYSIIQPFIYHAILLTWGIFTLITKQVSLKLNEIWQPILGLIPIALWGTMGIVIYDNNFMFLTTDISAFAPQFLLIPSIAVLACLCLLFLYLLVLLIEKIRKVSKVKNSNTFEK